MVTTRDDGTLVLTRADGSKLVRFADGTTIESNKEAEKYTDRGDVRVECAGACQARRSILI